MNIGKILIKKRKREKKMKKLLVVLLVGALALGLGGVAMAVEDTGASGVTVTFSEIAELVVSGNPGTLTIDPPAAAGDLPADVSDATTTMGWTTNVAGETSRKISGSLDVLFSGINLYGTVAAPGGDDGVSAGELLFAVATTGYDFVTGVKNCNVTLQTITFRVNVTGMVAPYTATANTVSWTLTAAA